ncbi:MAG: hypothetical protein Kilf2KO_42590 [Rhodospirillales bacterium]
MAPDAAAIAVLDDLGQGLPRWSDETLPPYRFIPGLTPHPQADPRGYAYGVAAAVVAPLPPEAWRNSANYLQGCDLYNRGYWWEAHEAWEALWQVTRARPDQHRFLQGLIQSANAHLKLALGKPRAVARLWSKAGGHFDLALAEGAGSEGIMGLALAPWRAATDAYLTERLARATDRHNPAAFPYIELFPT